MKLFGTSGIRGVYLKEITPDLMYKLGLALSTFLGNKGNIIIGGDCRLSTQVLKLSLVTGLMAGGITVFDAGLIPIPVLAYGIVKYGCIGGIYVTASHNPPEYNGVKVFNAKGLELRSSDEEYLEELIESSSFKYVDWSSLGSYLILSGLNEEYLEELSSRLMPSEVRRRVKVLLDTANCATSITTPKLLSNLGAHVISINSNIDGRFPGREPEPRPDVLEHYIPAARSLNVDIYLAHDGDGDRLAIIDPVDGFVKQDRVIALMFKYKLIKEGGGYVVASIDCGNAVREVVEKYGGKLIISKLGKIHEALIEHNALMAAEPWKLIDPSWGLWIDSIYQAGLVVKMMIEEGKSINELLRDIPNYPQARYSIKVPSNLKMEVYEHLRNCIESKAPNTARILGIDGLRVDYDDSSWILIRPSGTEAKVRIYAEGKDIRRVKELADDVIRICRDYLKSRGMELELDGALIP